MTEIFNQENLTVFWQLFLAVVLGGAIGIERELAHKTAGLRTFALVSMGSALFAIISKYAFTEFWGVPGFDPSRIASQVVVGIGFIGAGLIFLKQNQIQGLTTAAGLWVSAAIGLAVGFQLYTIAIFATILTIVILLVLWLVEHRLIERVLPVKDANSLDDQNK